VDHFVTQIQQRLENLPGVEAAASTVMLPVECCIDLPFNIVGKPPSQGQWNGDEQWRSATPHYFQAFRIPIVRGRAFRESDTGNSARVVIINEKMAKQYWPKEDPLGQAIVIGKGIGPEFEEPPRQIIGIAGNVREAGLQRGEVGVMYVPGSQITEGMTKLAISVIPLSWTVRTTGDPGAMQAAVEREIHAIDGTVPITQARSMEEVIGQSVARETFTMTLLSTFAAIALVLAGIGIYGLMAYTVEQRTQEIGIRMALGAARPDILKLMLAGGMKLALAGVLAGAALAFAMTHLLASLLFGVQASDPLTFVAVAAILGAVALLATWIPARRASTVEPSEALRYS
jgi:predicted permease